MSINYICLQIKIKHKMRPTFPLSLFVLRLMSAVKVSGALVAATAAAAVETAMVRTDTLLNSRKGELVCAFHSFAFRRKKKNEEKK